MIRLALALAAALAAPPALAQGTGGSATVTFNLFEIEGLSRSRSFDFGPGYTDRFGIEVPVPFRIDTPMHDQIDMIADGAPDGGAFVKFTFTTITEPRRFLENIQVVTARIPLVPEAEDPVETRAALSARLLEQEVFPRAVEGFETPEILAVERIAVGEVIAVQLIGRYVDPAIGPMLVRLVALPHPDRAESYVTVANINLGLVPVRDGETLAASLTGRIVSSWMYYQP